MKINWLNKWADASSRAQLLDAKVKALQEEIEAKGALIRELLDFEARVRDELLRLDRARDELAVITAQVQEIDHRVAYVRESLSGKAVTP